MIPANLLAGESGNVSIYPANFDPANPATRGEFRVEINSGESQNLQVVVENKSDSEKEYLVYAVDATTTEDGVFSLYAKGKRDDLAGWIELSQGEILLKGKERKQIDFRINVPKNVAVGDHVAGIVVEEKQSNKNEGVNIVTRVGVRVYAKVKGAEVESVTLDSLEVEGFITGKSLNLTIKNNGNISQKVRTEYTVLGLSGLKMIETEGERVVLPGKEIKLSEQLDVVAPLYLTAQTNYGKNLNLVQSVKILTPAAYFIIGFLLILVASFFVLLKYLFRKNR